MKFWTYTWLEAVNKLFFQWLFIRLYKEVDADTKKIIGYGLLVGILPLTGWCSDYIGPGWKIPF